jgi:octaprenyl-diphosphate synthase
MNHYMPSPSEDMASRLKAQILAGVKDDLVAVEAELAAHLHPQFDLVAKVAGHILFSGGKRLRPLLMILCTRLCGYQGKHGAGYATAFEYLHAATLLHDDLIDGGTLRRGKPAGHTVYGNEIAVLTGDFLLARALAVATTTGNLDIVRTIVDITEQMSQGEIDQLDKKGQLTITEAEYLEIIRRKTAVLFQGACRVGGVIAGADPAVVAGLSEYGHHLGMAFQMTDDLLDYTADVEILGKKTGADLKEGKLTLPVIHALSRADEQDRLKMETIISNNHFSPKDFGVLIELLRKYDGIEYTWQKAASAISRAKDALLAFPSDQTQKTLLAVADYALARKQ